MSKPEKPGADTLSDVLGDELAAQLRSPADASTVPGPAPWEVAANEREAVPAVAPLPNGGSVEEVSTAEIISDATDALGGTADPAPIAEGVEQEPSVAHDVSRAAAPEPTEAIHEDGSPPALVDPRGTEELLAEVMPMRRFGKRHAQWAAGELWPRLRRFPTDVLVPLWRRVLAWIDAVRVRIWAWPRPAKVAAVAAALSVITAILVVWLAPWSNRQFVQEPTWLSAGPSLEAADFPRAGVLQAREPVTVLEELESLALVVDSVGRVGYVARVALSDSAPVPGPDQPFTRCGRLPGEAADSACEGRAQQQRAECLETCEVADDSAACTGNCEMRSNHCVAGCALAVVPVLPAGAEPEPSPVADGPTEVLTGEPEDTGDDEATAADRVETTADPGTKPAPKKKPRKRRRRSRKKR